MVKGGKSLNPNGRPKGAAGIAKYVASQTNGGAELIDRLLELSRSPKTPVRERLAATSALLDRVAGKALQPSQIAMTLSEAPKASALLQIAPEHRLAALDAWRAQKVLGPPPEQDEQQETDEEQEHE